MNIHTPTIIDSLLVDDNAKETLRIVAKLANSKNGRVRDSVPSLLVVAESGCGFSCYGKAYSRILDDSLILQTRGSSTFLELVFPKDNSFDEKLFFSSPQRVASITNRFYGTMLISLEEYTGQDLLKSSGFQSLLDFIEINKKNIYFLFRVPPLFSAKKQLMARLLEHINIIEVVLDKPNIEKGFNYVVSELNELGYMIEEKAQRNLKDKILPEMISRKEYAGYRSLNNLVDRISYEMAISTTEENGVIHSEITEKLMSKYEEEQVGITELPQMGFRV